MLTIDGKRYKTIADAARGFKVAAKTLQDWIRKGIIDEPPKVEYGVRLIAYFPPEYVRSARSKLRRYQKSKEAQRRTRK